MEPTVLIGLDGATFSILDLLVENGTMPFLKQFIKSGVRAQLLSTPNPLTPPAWTSLMTGRSPGNHGIIDFIWAEERKTDHYFTLYNFRDIQCETIWSIISRQQGNSCVLNFPIMSPPPAISGCIVPGLVSWKHLRRNIYPPKLYQELKELPGFNPKEFAWDFGMEKKAAKGIPRDEYENWILFHIRRERHWFKIAEYIMQKDLPDLMAILFDGPDKMLHMGWRFLDPSLYPNNPSPWEQRIRDLLLDFFRELDGFLAKIVDLAGTRARVFMASDHGFGPAWQVFRVNSWLHKEGYLNWKEVELTDEKTRKSVDRLVDQHFVLLDWNNTTAYARSLTSNGIYIRVAEEPGQGGVPINQYDTFRREMIEKLKALTDPDTGKPVIKNILTKEEAYPGSHNNQAPDLTLIMRDHSFISILNKTPIVCRRPEIEGTHYPEGIFLAGGPGIRKSLATAQLSILDVAPTLLYSLGIHIPSDFEGRLPVEIFETSFFSKHPQQKGGPTQPPASYALKQEEYITPEDEEKKIFDQLQALGYLE
ncbi:MAG: alkaline phosphatase family protein [Deltaproteobacteria bacterium]|nr:alkaline phosphatase family protein [Deltaproteobacteria bacterium]